MTTKTWGVWLAFALVGCNGEGSGADDDGTGTVSATDESDGDDGPGDDGPDDDGPDDDGPDDDGPDDDGPSDDGPLDDGPLDDGPAETGEDTSADGLTDPSDDSSDDGDDASTTDTPAQCGDGTCDAAESSASCCSDCGCADGSSCIEDTCVVDPFCGDGACNGAETQDACCVDCGCQAGSACEAGSCVVQPFCGDGACNGAETADSCCNDCGCGDANYSCEGNACVCSNAWFHFENELFDVDQFCFATNSFYTQQATAYFNDNVGSGWIYMPQDGWYENTGDIGDSVNGTQQCCMLDPCLGNLSCPTPFGNYPCICNDPVPLAATIATCGENYVSVCG